MLRHGCVGHGLEYILSHKRNCTLLKSKCLSDQRLLEIFWKLSSHPCQWFSINFMSISENDRGHCTFFVISKFLMPLPRSTIAKYFCLDRVSLHPETAEKHVFPRLAQSVTCTNTRRLSGGDCLRDAGMLQPGVLHIRVAANFDRDTVLNLWKHYHASSLHVSIVNFLTASTWCQRDTASIPWSQTCATASQ